MRDHGGNLDEAMAIYGGAAADWIDLSTGINRCSYPLPTLSTKHWQALPTQAAMAALCKAAASAYGATAEVFALAGAQAAIQLIPRLRLPGEMRVLSPTYNEHAAAFAAQGWSVVEVETLDGLAGADAAVVVNPNNPDGQIYHSEVLLALTKRVGLLVVDESFADTCPDISLAPHCGRRGLIVLRSFGKFYGLAGMRLGFAIGHTDDLAELTRMAGPWAVSGPALEIGSMALGDTDWQQRMRVRLKADAARLDKMALQAGWCLVGGTDLFRTYETPSAADAKLHLAKHHIWPRIFPYSTTWVRLGLPGAECEWRRLEAALKGV